MKDHRTVKECSHPPQRCPTEGKDSVIPGICPQCKFPPPLCSILGGWCGHKVGREVERIQTSEEQSLKTPQVLQQPRLKPSEGRCLPDRPFRMGRTKLRPDRGLEPGSSQVGPTGRTVLFAGILETASRGVSIRTQCGNSSKDQSLWEPTRQEGWCGIRKRRTNRTAVISESGLDLISKAAARDVNES